MLLELPPIEPVVAASRWWWLLAVGALVLALAVLAVGVWRWRALRPSPPDVDTSLERLRESALEQVGADALLERPKDAAQALSRTVRRFVGVASGGNADYEPASQLAAAAERDRRLAPVAALVSDLQEVSFSASPGDGFDVAARAEQAREVIRAWR
ncbi:hypothetical protein [uncultured Tessaracoccus sp.]|uniref:hypothetical protein n=1 Tax=uncultured Tessaracoccus sp. TaxID=905023 RepID=UPI00262EC291|nr:hypothetical protein [uncultured Tessaracoccus sp.]